MSPDSPLWANTGVYGPEPVSLQLHAGIEVGIVLAGGEEVRFHDYLMAGSPGDVWLCAMWEPHAFQITKPGTENAVAIFLPVLLGEETFDHLPWLSLFSVTPSQRPRVRTREMRETVVAIGRELQREISEKTRGWQTAVRLGLTRLLFSLSRGWQPPTSAGGPSRPRSGSLSRIMPALTLLHERNARHVSLSEAAAACNLGRSRFNALFGQAMGLSFGRFCLRARVGMAAHLLLTSSLPVEAVAAEAGFTDASHFHRTFVKHYGCTPGRYRQQGQ